MTCAPNKTLIRYEREGELVRVTFTGVTNHELREVMIGLWARLDAADREDHLGELDHYQHDPDAWLGPVAVAIKEAGDGGEGQIDLAVLRARGERVRP